MCNLRLSMLALFFLTLVANSAQAAVSDTEANLASPLIDAPLVYNLTQIRLAVVVKDSVCWVVGRTEAQRKGGFEFVYDNAAHMYKTISDGSLSTQWVGTIAKKEQVHLSTPKTSWKFVSVDPILPVSNFGIHGGTRFANISYQDGQTLIGRVASDTSLKPLSPAYAIPSRWEPDIVSALKIYEAHGGLLMDVRPRRSSVAPSSEIQQWLLNLSVSNFAVSDEAFHHLARQKVPQLQQATMDPNPFIATDAFRVLAENHQLDQDTIVGRLHDTTELRQAVMADLALSDTFSGLQGVDEQTTRDQAVASNRTAVESAIGKAKTSAELKGIALAAFMENDAAILKALDIRQKQINTKTSADEYVSEILQITRIRARPKTHLIITPTSP